MMRTRSGIVLVVLLVGAAVCIDGTPATSGDFGVNPTTILLSPTQTSRLLTLSNSSNIPIRFQARAYAWEQLPNGETRLDDTRELVVFPPLVSVAGGEERRLRIGAVGGASAVERNYRIILEQLPPHVGPGDVPPAGLTVLTRLSIPVFVRPGAPKAQATLRGLQLRDGAVAFSLDNTGNVHFLVTSVRVKALGRNGTTLFDQPIQGWYVLAAGRRDYAVPMPDAACAQTASLLVEARIANQSVSDRLAVAQPSCGLDKP